ncbi:MAG: protein-tyrosine-phosphatase [Bacteroidota bacterium]
MNEKLNDLIQKLMKEIDLISQDRRAELDHIASTIQNHLKTENTLDIIVVCTHNSRRSQLGELWINQLAYYHKLDRISAFSGGMEATAFNHRMVAAVREAGFVLEEKEKGTNPKYVAAEEYDSEHTMFSKVYDHPMNPQRRYMALMVCDHADENCPVVIGMKYRIPLRYKDPKEFDDTDAESKAYGDKVEEIGREMIYLFNKLTS